MPSDAPLLSNSLSAEQIAHLRERAMFVRTRSFEDIVERAHALVLDGIGARLRSIPGVA